MIAHLVDGTCDPAQTSCIAPDSTAGHILLAVASSLNFYGEFVTVAAVALGVGALLYGIYWCWCFFHEFFWGYKR